MRELRAITERLRATFEGAGYGEVWTPALEYEDVLRIGDDDAAGAGYRMFDEQGHVMALRSDMTIPIARVVATRYQDMAEPLRLCYFAHAYRAVEHGSGHEREFLQGGLELVGVEGAEGEAEIISLILAALDEAGLSRHRVGLGDGALYSTLLDALEVPSERHAELLERLSAPRSRRPRAEGRPARAAQGRPRPAGLACPRCAAGPRCSTAPGGRRVRRWTACVRYTPRSWTGASPTA